MPGGLGISVNGNEGTVLLFPQPSRNDRLGEEQSYPETLLSLHLLMEFRV